MSRIKYLLYILLIISVVGSFVFVLNLNIGNEPENEIESESESEFESDSMLSDSAAEFETENHTETADSSTLENNPFSDLTMVCLGDSITMGSEIEVPYSELVKDSLGLKSVYNYGVGWSTIGLLEDCTCHANISYEYDHHPYVYRYNKMQDADIVAVMGGNNDWGIGIPVGDIHDADETTFCGALNKLIAGLKEKYPDSYIFFMTLFNYVPDRINKDGVSWIEYNNAIRAVCAKEGIDVFDVYNEIPFDKLENTVDGVHPTQEFVSNVWSPAMGEFIRQNYK